MKTDRPTGALIPQLRLLWKEAFGDTDAFLDLFFTTAYAPERCRVLTEGGHLLAALYWFDVSCSGQKFAYIYAVATAAAARGKGLCRTLMTETAGVLKAAGYRGALLVPQDDGLRAMYGRMGYLPATAVDEFSCAAGAAAVPLVEITPAEYAALRPAFVPDGSAELDAKGLAFWSALARFYKGTGFLAAVSREEAQLWIPEYLGDRDMASALVAALGRTEATVRCPGGHRKFAMYLPLTADCRKPEYYPFAFD